MKKYLYLFVCLFIISCGNKNNSVSTSVETPPKENLDSNSDSMKTTTSINESSNPAKKRKLGAKYVDLVEKGILTSDEAKSYAEVESKYHKLRVKFQETGNWKGSSPENISQRKKWRENKNTEVIAAIGQGKYDKVNEYLQSKK